MENKEKEELENFYIKELEVLMSKEYRDRLDKSHLPENLLEMLPEKMSRVQIVKLITE